MKRLMSAWSERFAAPVTARLLRRLGHWAAAGVDDVVVAERHVQRGVAFKRRRQRLEKRRSPEVVMIEDREVFAPRVSERRPVVSSRPKPAGVSEVDDPRIVEGF